MCFKGSSTTSVKNVFKRTFESKEGRNMRWVEFPSWQRQRALCAFSRTVVACLALFWLLFPDTFQPSTMLTMLHHGTFLWYTTKQNQQNSQFTGLYRICFQINSSFKKILISGPVKWLSSYKNVLYQPENLRGLAPPQVLWQKEIISFQNLAFSPHTCSVAGTSTTSTHNKEVF